MSSGFDGINLAGQSVGSFELGKIIENSSGGDQSEGLYVAVAEEVIYDPGRFLNITHLGNNSIWSKFQRIVDPTQLSDLPANTIIAKIIVDKSIDNAEICFPMFPSHLQFPVKPGEQIFVYKLGDTYFWLCRVPGNYSTEDVNFTHVDRKHIIQSDQPLGTKEEKKQESQTKTNYVIGEFNNGAITEDAQTLRPPGYDGIIESKSTITRDSATYEPVPTYLKRPGDFVIQGSNNTLISLGQQRGWKKNIPTPDGTTTQNFLAPNSNVHYIENKINAGAIDLVTGRGRLLPFPADEEYPGEAPFRTSCRTIFNRRAGAKYDQTSGRAVEAWRFSALRGIVPNQSEGDPDYEYDAARLLIGMGGDSNNLSADALFSLVELDDEPILPKISFWKDNNLQEEVAAEHLGGSHVVAKADHIRLIARQQLLSNEIPIDPEIRGSVRIIKEGVLNSEAGDGKSMILMEQDGTILIDGPTIIVGGGNEAQEKPNGEGTQIILGKGATEPIVLGNELKDLLDKHFNDIKTHLTDLKSYLKNNFDTHVHPTGVGPSLKPMVDSTILRTSIDQTNAAIDESITDLVNTLSKFGKTK